MATRTLGIKFQIAGLTEARNSLKEFKDNINQSLKTNEQSAKKQINANVELVKSEKKRAKLIEQTNSKILASSYRFNQKLKTYNRQALENTNRFIKINQKSIKDSINAYFIKNYGSTIQKQRLIIKEERASLKQRSTNRSLTKSDRSQVLENRLIFKEFVLDLKKIVKEDLSQVIKENAKDVSNSETTVEKFVNVAKAPFEIATKAILSPIEAIIFGALQKIGESQVTDFAEGVSSQMQKSLGLQFRELGQDVGGAIGSSMYLAYEKIMTATRNSVLDRHPVSGSNETLHLQKLLSDFGEILQGFVISLGAIPIKVKKRIDIDKKGIPQVKERAGQLLIERELTPSQHEDIEKSKSISILTGGANYDEEAGTTNFAYAVLQPMLGNSYVHPVKNLFSNAQGTEDFERIFGELLQLGMQQAESRKMLLEFAKNSMPETSKDSEHHISNEEIETIFVGDSKEVAQKITEFAKKINLPLPKILEVVFKGYNPDDIMMAAEGIYFKEKYPDKPLQFIGTSFGGFNAAGSAELMNRMGYTDVKAVGITTPLIGAESTVNPDNYFASIGELDFLYEATLGKVFKDKIPKPDNLQVVPNQGKGHLLGHFLANSSEFRNYLQYFLKDRVDVPSIEEYTPKEVMAMGRIPGNHAESALIRTIKKNIGEKYTEGYTFNEEDLIAHRNHLVYLATGDKRLAANEKLLKTKNFKKFKNPEIKQFHQEYIDFLDTLIEELEIIEKFKQIGKKIKPIKSLQKGASFYPDLENFLFKHDSYDLTESEINSGLQEVENNKNLVNFKRKIDNESGNIERTYRAILGEDISKKGYGYYDDKEYRTRAEEHLGGLIYYLENDILKNASINEKAEAEPYLKSLKRLQKTIIAVGETGYVNPKEIKQAEKLFNLNLKEYKSVLSNNKGLDVKNRKNEIQSIAARKKSSKQSKLVMDVKPELEAYIWAINQELIREGKKQIDVQTAEYLGSGYWNHAIKANGKVFKIAKHTNPLAQQLRKVFGKKSSKSFANEINALKKLKGDSAPNLIAGAENFVSMSEIEGITLERALSQASSERRKELIRKAAELLKSFHAKGITHGDFYPANIILGNDDKLYGIDWQASKITQNKKEHYQDLLVAIKRFKAYLVDNAGLEDSSTIENLFKETYGIEDTSDNITTRTSTSEPSEASPVSSNNLEIARAYNQQLQRIIQNTARQFEEDLANESINIDTSSAYNEIAAKIREYRDRVAESNFEQARRLGEELLHETEYLKQSFNRSGDRRAGQLTRIQNEILQGNGGRGRAEISLAQLAENVGADLNIINFENISDVNQRIAEAYSQQLTRIIENTARQFEQDLANESINVSTNSAYQTIRAKIREYRNRVAESNFEQARRLGEELLHETEYLKQLFNRSNDGRASQMTRIQNEILRGSNAPGSAQISLPNLTYTSGAEQLLIDFENLGDQAQAGFDRGANGRESGQQFAEDVTDSTQEGLDIESPSKVFEWIGGMVKAGFNNGVEGIGNYISESLANVSDEARDRMRSLAEGVSNVAGDLDESDGLFGSLLDNENADEEINNFFGGIISQASEFFDLLKQRFPLLNKLSEFLVSIGGDLLQAIGLFSFGEALIQFSGDALAASMQLESLERSIIAVSRNATAGAENIKFIRNEAKRLSIDLIAAEEAYKRILGATRNTPLEGLQTQQIFSTLAATARNRGLDTDATNRLFLGIEQVIAKGEFKSEEVRGQLAEVLGDIQNLLATAVGVPLSQLNELMEAGDLKAAEVMPKLLALLNAQNSAIGSSAQTAQAAQTRFNNSLLEFKDAVGRLLQPIQKLNLNFLSTALETLRERINLIINLVVSLVSTVLVNLIVKLLATKLVTLALGDAIYRLGFALGAVLPKLLLFLQRFVLISVAIQVWNNNLKLTKNAFGDLQKRIEASTDRLNALKQAFDSAGNAAKNYSKNSTLQLNEGAKVPEWLQAVAGGERLNLDNLVRNRLNSLYDRPGGKFLRYGILGFLAKDGKTTTQAQKKQADFVVGTSDLMMNADRTLGYGSEAKFVLTEIQQLDVQARDLQSQRLNILPGDTQALQEALEAERKVLEKRDKLLGLTAQYQESLQGDIQDLEKSLLKLSQLDNTGGSKEEQKQRANNKKSLEEKLKLHKTEKKAIDEINSRIPKFLSETERLIRNSDERVKGFLSTQEDESLTRSNALTRSAIDNNLSSEELQIELDDASEKDLTERINFVKKEINSLENRLKSAYLQEGVTGLERSAETQGLELTPDTLERMLDEDRNAQETKAAKALLPLDEYQTIVAQAESELLNLTKTKKDRFKELNRSIKDYFFRLIQQIKEAQVEVDRLIQQLFYGDIKSRLKAAIAPGTESFMNGIIESVQGVIDQAASISEKVLGQDSALIGFETKQYDLQTQLQDFARSIAGASDAVGEFVRSLKVGTFHETSVQGSGVRGQGSWVRNQPTFPVAGLNLQKAKITSGYGWRNIFGRKDFHEGIDIAASGGTNVIAANAGVVKYIKPLADQMQVGVESITATGEKVQEWYIHLARNLNVKVGDRISKGQQIGKVAFTSNAARRARVSTGDHLDYRVMVNGKWVNPKQFLNREMGNNSPTTVNNYSRSLTQDNNILSAAQQLNQELLNKEALKIDLKGSELNIDRRNFKIDTRQKKAANRRQFFNQEIEADRATEQMRNRMIDLKQSASLPNAEIELQKNLTTTKSQFGDFDYEVFQQLRKLTDFVQTAQNFIVAAPYEIDKLRASGTQEGIEAADFMAETLKQTQAALPGYLKLVEEITQLQKDLPSAQVEALKFIEWQGKLKIEQERLQKQSLLSQLKLNMATVRGTLEERKQQELVQERLRLEQRITEIKLQYGETDYGLELIAKEKENSQVQELKIDWEATNRELNLEKQLLDLQSEQTGKKASLLGFIGLDLEGNKIQREAAVNSEMLRYRQQVEQLKQSYAGEPEKLAELLKNAKELNKLNLSNIKLQFKSLGTQLQELSFKNLEGFFSNLFTVFTGSGERQQQILQANLDYAQQLNEAHEKFKRNPQELAQAKNRLKELNNQKLDALRNEFNLFNRVVNFAKQAVSEFLKSFAQMMARRAAAGIFKSLGLGIGLGFKDGGTVPNYADGGTTGKNTDRIVAPHLASFLSSSSQPIRDAFNREGNQGVLAVFTPGEEILSLKTGEAQRYRALKSGLGVNPLQSIFAGNFSDGGTIEGNILSSMASSKFRFDGSSINKTTSNNNITRSGVVNINVTTPNADSFRASEHQLGLDAAESLRRSMRR